MGRREVTPSEQHVHSFLEVIPFIVVSFMICLYWEQFLVLVGIRRERQPLSWGYVGGILAAVAALVVLPYSEEFWRCYRVDHTLDDHLVTAQAQQG